MCVIEAWCTGAPAVLRCWWRSHPGGGCLWLRLTREHCGCRQWELFLHRFGPFNSCLKRVRARWLRGYSSTVRVGTHACGIRAVHWRAGELRARASVSACARALDLRACALTPVLGTGTQATDSFFNGPKLELVPWFHGPISRARAQTVLHTGPKGGSPGHFLVRFSEKCPEYFTLSYLAPAPTGTVMRNVLVYNLGEVRRVGLRC